MTIPNIGSLDPGTDGGRRKKSVERGEVDETGVFLVSLG